MTFVLVGRSVKEQLESLLSRALDALRAEGLDLPDVVTPQVSRAKDRVHGDFASNIAMQLAKPVGLPPVYSPSV